MSTSIRKEQLRLWTCHKADGAYQGHVTIDACPSGYTTDPDSGNCRPSTCPVDSQYNPITNSCTGIVCNGDPGPVAAARRIGFIVEPITCTMNGNIASCTGPTPHAAQNGTGKTFTMDIECKSTAGDNTGGVKPEPVPSPAPDVAVDYPKCPQGSYRFTDVDGSSYCTNPVEDNDIADSANCASGNAGFVNDKFVCLPSNPAPSVAANAANDAIAKAGAAKAVPGTPAAADAARGAAADAQRAKEAADSLKPSHPQQPATVGNAGKAIDAAKQAAGYAGVPYGGPSGGTSDTGQQCGVSGKPACTTKIDESGTPSGQGALDGAKGALDSATADAIAKLGDVTSANGKDTSWGWVPLSWVQPGACQALNLGTLPVIEVAIDFDICPQLAMASELLTFFWAMGTIWLCVSMVWTTIQGQGA